MSKIVSEKDFISLLTSKRTSEEQKASLLLTCNNSQLTALVTVFKNCLKTDIPLPRLIKREIKSKAKQKLLKSLTGKNSNVQKRKVIAKHYLWLIKLLKNCHSLLQGLIVSA